MLHLYILCGTEQNDSGIDSIKLEEYTAVLGNRVSLDSIAGTYNGVLPANVETTLTLNADGTYLLIQSEHWKVEQTGKVKRNFPSAWLQHPDACASFEWWQFFHKVIDTNFIILIDSFSNETKKEDGKNYILNKKVWRV